MKGLFQSKTFWGVLLGVLGVILDATNFMALPALAVKIVEAAGFLIGVMGLRDAINKSQATLIKKILDLKSKTFWGVIIEAVVHLTEVGDTLTIPEELKIVLKVLGALAIAIGLRDAAQKRQLV